MITSSLKKKIIEHVKSRSGMGSIMTVLGAAIAAALIVFPLTRWQMSLTQNIAATTQNMQNMNTEFEARSALEDRWREINDMSFDELIAATNKWSKATATQYGKYLVWEKYGTVGTYNSSTGQCNTGQTPTENDKACRVTTLQTTDATGATVYSTVTSTRIASAAKKAKNNQKTILWDLTNNKSKLGKTIIAPDNGMILMWTCFHCNLIQFNIYVNGYQTIHQDVSTCDTIEPFMVNKGDVINITTGAAPTSGYFDLRVYIIPTS